MNGFKSLLEEILPFYFFLMIFVLLFSEYQPTRFELYIVYAFSFAVAVFNNRLYSQNADMSSLYNKLIDKYIDLKDKNGILKAEVERYQNFMKHGLITDVENDVEDTKRGDS